MKMLLIFAFGLGSISAFATHYFVSTKGSDKNAGLSPEQPFKTIQMAANKMQAGDTCFVLGGVYRETITFRNSGTDTKPIVLMPYKKQMVVVTGLDIVQGWQKTSQGYWKTNQAWNIGKGKGQLFYKGEVMIEARYPNTPNDSLKLPVKGLSKLQPTFGNFSVKDCTKVVNLERAGLPKGDWKGAMYYGLHYNGWCGQSAVVKSSMDNVLTVERPSGRWWWFKKPNYIKRELGRGMLVGHRNALDRGSEWILENGSELTFITPDGETPHGKTEFKKRQLAFDLSGQSYIAIAGIDVKAASIKMKDAEHCSISKSKIHYISHFTIFDDARNGQIDKLGNRSPLVDGEVGIYLSGQYNSIINCDIQFSAGAGIYLDGYGHTVHNNLISECSYTCTYMPGLMFGVQADLLCGGHIITYNTVRYNGRSLLHFDGNNLSRDGQPAKYAALLIANNYLHDGMLQGRDGGIVNSFYTDAGAYNGTASQFTHNVLSNCYDPMVILFNWDLGVAYWDNNTWNIHCTNNLVSAKPGSVQIDQIFNAPSVNALWSNGKFLSNFSRAMPDNSDFPNNEPFDFGHNFSKQRPIAKWGPTILANLPMENQEIKMGTTIIKKEVNLDGVQSMVFRYKNDNALLNKHETLGNWRFVGNPFNNSKLILQAEKATATSNETELQWSVSKFTTNGGYLKYKGIDFGKGYEKLVIFYASAVRSKKWMELRLDSLNASPISTIELPFAESDNRYSKPQKILYPFVKLEANVPATLVGKHDVYWVLKGEDNRELAQLRMLRFEDYRGTVDLKENEGVVEIRVDTSDGKVLGEFYPQFTDGTFKESCIDFGNKKFVGKHDLYITYRTGLSTPVIANSLRLERGQE